MAKRIAKSLLLATFVVAAAVVVAQTSRQPPVVNVAVVTDGTSERTRALRALFLEEMRAVNRGDFELRAPIDLQLEADRTLTGASEALQRVLSDRRTDLVVTLGVLVSHAAAQHHSLPKPVVAPFVTDRGLQNLPYQDGASGKRNLSYVSVDVDIGRDLRAFRDVVPFSRLAFLIDRSMTAVLPGVHAELQRVARDLRIAVTPVGVTDSAAEALAHIPQDAQAVYVGPLPALSSQEYQRLVDGLIARRLPSFAFEGKTDVERGLLVGIAPALQMERVARRVALNARRILLGEDAATLPVAFARAEGLTLNMRTARAIGFSPSWRLLTSAELLYDEPEAGGPPLSLAGAVQQALELNLDLRIAQSTVEAGRQDVRGARAALLPQIGVAGQHTSIEADDARVVPGRAQGTTSAAITFDWPLYSEPARANLDVQKQLQLAREIDREQARLDIVLATTDAYLAVLRAKTNERIQKNNLQLTRSNGELARARRRIGTAGPSEVYRWDSEVANARRSVVDAQAQERVAEIGLNSLLHRPLEQPVATIEVGLDEPILISSQQRLYELIDNPASFDVFRDFVVQEGMSAVPELRRLDAQIVAQERTLESARRAYTHPTLSLQGSHSQTLARSGARGPALPGLDDHETTVALQLSIPLYTGGGRDARRVKAYEELAGLRVQREAVAERVEQRARAALHTARGALTAIRLSRDAATAAQANLDVVRDAYSRGTVSVLDLLDAQNAALVADLRAATGVYDFLRSLMEVERAVARFDFFVTQQEQAEWLTRLERYFEQRGMPVPRR
jgi:outer membrane protein